MPSTPQLAIPYPDADDAITDWPTQAQALAEKVEEVVVEAASEIAIVTRTTNAGGGASAVVLSLPSHDYGGEPIWLEFFCYSWNAGALSSGGGGGAGAMYLRDAGALVALFASQAPLNPTDQGSSLSPVYAKIPYTPAVGARVLDWYIAGASGPTVFAGTGVGGAGAKAWMRATRAAA